MIEQLLPRLIGGLVLLALFVWLMHELHKRGLLRQLDLELHEGGWLGRGLRHGWRLRLPVYSAETVAGKEAEFIRDRLPTQFPTFLAIVVVSIGVLLAIWWAMR